MEEESLEISVLIHRWGEWDPEKATDLLKVAQEVNCRARPRTRPSDSSQIFLVGI